MKIKGTCARCGREFLAQQVIEAHGHCPWCGQAFNRDYTANLAHALQEAEVAGNRLQDALQQIAGMELAMELDDETVLGPIRNELRAARRRRSKV
jgi:PHP family Zn ribbon phosphoesterase